MRGTGRVVFAATLLLIVGTLNIIYGIGALDDANYFVNQTRYMASVGLAEGFSVLAASRYFSASAFWRARASSTPRFKFDSKTLGLASTALR